MKRFNIDSETAKKFFYDREEAKAEGVRLPFYKWKKKHLSFDESMGEVEEGEFDNFFSRKKRKKLRSRLRGIRGRIKRGVLKGGIRGLIRQKKRKGKKIGGILRKLANPMYMANPRNVRKVFGGVRAMAKDIVRKDKAQINRMVGGRMTGGRRPIGRPNPYYRPQGRPNPYQQVMRYPSDIEHSAEYNSKMGYFDGYSDDSFLNAKGGGMMAKVKKYKWFIVGAGAVAFLFFTPMGKKLIK